MKTSNCFSQINTARLLIHRWFTLKIFSEAWIISSFFYYINVLSVQFLDWNNFFRGGGGQESGLNSITFPTNKNCYLYYGKAQFLRLDEYPSLVYNITKSMCLYAGKGFFILFFLAHIFKELLVSGKITLSWPWSFSRFNLAKQKLLLIHFSSVTSLSLPFKKE